jgi:creatinine amidohydrolase/Fe(II)-dependent formamide hydrolase-like protein
MRWPGTITVPPAAFEAVLESAARSLRQAGLCQVVLLGDHGGYRGSLDRVAARVNRGWAATGPCRVHSLPEYYRAATTDYAAMLKSRGHGQGEIGTHAGLADTSLMLAVDPALVRIDALGGNASSAAVNGVNGDPRRASAELGRMGADHIVEASVNAIRAAIPALATGRPAP